MIHLECGSGWCTEQDTPDWDCGGAGSPARLPYPAWSGPQGSPRPPWVPASGPQAGVPLAEVRPDAPPSHRPPIPELTEVRVAQRARKFDPGLGEGRCVGRWDALGPLDGPPQSPPQKGARGGVASVGPPGPGSAGLEWGEGLPATSPLLLTQLCDLTGVWPRPPRGTKAFCPGGRGGREPPPDPFPSPFTFPTAAAAPPRGGGAGRGRGADAG